MKKTYLAAIISGTLMVAACGSSSNSNDAPDANAVPPPAPAPDSGNQTVTSSTNLKSGLISAFGSIYVDGERFDTDGATVSANGVSATLDDLKVGMNVNFIYQTDEQGATSVTSIHYESDIEGVIDSIDRNNQIITIAGLVVQYNDQTHFWTTSETELVPGTRVEVSGFPQADGRFFATFIEPDVELENYTELAGIITELDTDKQIFHFGDLRISYANARLPQSALANYQAVEVKGNLEDAMFVASDIEFDDVDFAIDIEELNKAEIKGVVTAYVNGTNEISLNNTTYALTSNVQVSGGSLASLAVGDYVELDIDLSKSPAQVQKIEIKTATSSFEYGKLEGFITGIDVDADSINVNGMTFIVNPFTRYEDDNDHYIHFANLQVNDFVEVVFVDDGAQYVVKKLEREERAEAYYDAESRGIISQLDTERVTVNGVTYTFASANRFVINDRLVTQSDFVAALAVGMQIEIEGYYNNANQFVATEFELENVSLTAPPMRVGYVELESRVQSIIDETSITLNGGTVKFDSATRFELNDRENVSLATFMSYLQVGMIVEIEGIWVDGNYIRALDVEIDND